ncbi:MAG: DUF4337 domain-containing protein, partial [Proteobacteria bacterium]|nr:DUF4337 domain-containing protein [Pseudomonadota bacterium]
RSWRRLQQKLEVALPLSIAIFAAVLAINDLLSGKYGSDEIKLSNLRNNSLQWYQAKGIKGTIVEGQIDLLKVMIKSGSIAPDKRADMEELMRQMQLKLDRYDGEKREILVGSHNVPADQWVQELDGKMGQVTGAKEYENEIEKLGDAGDYFDFASMLFQLCLVTGAVGILVTQTSMKWTFFKTTAFTGIVGIVLSLQGLWLALHA